MTKSLYTKATQGFLLLLAVAAFVIPAMTHEAPEGWVVNEGQHRVSISDRGEVNVPTWAEYADEFPSSCTEKGGLTDKVAVVTQGADAEVMDFDEAWDRSHDDEDANNVWVVGRCK